MKCLIDADVLAYEVPFATATALGDETPPWPAVEEKLERLIAHIEEEAMSTEPSVFFFTGKGNFRNAIAKRTPYKNRPSRKPHHHGTVIRYLKCNYESRQVDGLEADDLMSIEQSASGGSTIICTRDKDLRSVPGWHYGWEVGNQPSFGPRNLHGYGDLVLSDDRKKITGWGLKFFLSQCLTGDRVDSIPGLPGCGVVASFELLRDTRSYEEGLEAVAAAYHDKYGPTACQELTEQAQLLWMTRTLDEQGKPVLWSVWENYEG